MKENEEELIGLPSEEVPRIEPGYDCNARKTSDGIFKGYCKNRSGYKTKHVGEGRCWLHGGNSPRGENSPQFKHGLYSDHLSEDDREELAVIEEHGNLANLQSTIDYEFLRLRRAVRNIEDSDDTDRSFWDAFDQIIDEASNTGLGQEEISSMAELLDANFKAFNDHIERIRRLVKTYEELTEGKKVNIDGDMSHTHAGEEGGPPISIEWKESEAEREDSTTDNDNNTNQQTRDQNE